MNRIFRPTILLAFAAALLVGVLVFQGCDDSGAASRPFETAEVHRGDLVATVSATGTLSAVGTVEVGTQVSGTVEEVYADFNDRVDKGDLLAVLDTESLDAAVQNAQAGVGQAQAALHQAQARAAEAEATLDRNKKLFEKGYVAEQEFASVRTSAATTESEVASARATLISAEAGLTQARKNRRNAEIRAPISGIVIQRSVDAGQTVAASFSTPMLFIIAEDLGKMEILAQVDESDIGLVEPGQPVEFTVAAYPDRTFEGVAEEERLQPQTVQNVVLYTVVIAADNESGLLLPGMTATVDFVVGGVEDALLIPVAALRFDPPEAIRAAARETQREAEAARRNSTDSDGPVFAPDVAEVWTPKADADQGPPLRPVLVRILASDGTSTAIAPTEGTEDVVRPGLEVVTRMNTTDEDPFD